MIQKRFELADPNTIIPPGHLCNKCQFILFDVYRCEENGCSQFCKEHLPENQKCTGCDEALSFNQKLSENIKKKYKVKCNKCPQQMILEELNAHKCKLGCPQKCDSLFSSQQEIELHLKKECVNSEVECFACEEKDSRGMIEIHQMDCKKALKFNQQIEPLNKEILSLKQQNQNQNQEIVTLKQGKIKLFTST